MNKRIAIRDAYGDTLAKLGGENPKVVVLEADVGLYLCNYGKVDKGAVSTPLIRIVASLSRGLTEIRPIINQEA